MSFDYSVVVFPGSLPSLSGRNFIAPCLLYFTSDATTPRPAFNFTTVSCNATHVVATTPPGYGRGLSLYLTSASQTAVVSPQPLSYQVTPGTKNDALSGPLSAACGSMCNHLRISDSAGVSRDYSWPMLAFLAYSSFQYHLLLSPTTFHSLSSC